MRNITIAVLLIFSVSVHCSLRNLEDEGILIEPEKTQPTEPQKTQEKTQAQDVVPEGQYKELVQKSQRAYLLHFNHKDAVKNETFMSGMFSTTSKKIPLSMCPDISQQNTLIGLKTLNDDKSYASFGLESCKETQYCYFSEDKTEHADKYNGNAPGNQYQYVNGKTMIPLPDVISKSSFKNDQNNVFPVRFVISKDFSLQNTGLIGLSPKSHFLEWLSKNYHPEGEEEGKIGFTFSFNRNVITTDLLNGNWLHSLDNALRIGWYTEEEVINPQVYKNKDSEIRDRWAVGDAKLYIKDKKEPNTKDSKRAATLAGTACFITTANSMFAVRNKEDYDKLSKAMNNQLCGKDDCTEEVTNNHNAPNLRLSFPYVKRPEGVAEDARMEFSFEPKEYLHLKDKKYLEMSIAILDHFDYLCDPQDAFAVSKLFHLEGYLGHFVNKGVREIVIGEQAPYPTNAWSLEVRIIVASLCILLIVLFMVGCFVVGIRKYAVREDGDMTVYTGIEDF